MRPLVPFVALISLVPAFFILLSSSGYSEHATYSARDVDNNINGILTTENQPTEVPNQRPCNQRERKMSIKRYCDAHPELKTNMSRHPQSHLHPFHIFMVDERHKILFCAVPKAAVTLWRTMFLLGTGKVNQTKEKIKPYHGPYLNRMGLKFMYNYTEEQQEKILKTYLKVMSVRHPVERALSSYMDKFIFSEIEFPILESIDYINKNYRSENNQLKLAKGRQTIPSGVQFPEFVDMVSDMNAPYNIHWDSIINICHPCMIEYDYIMKTETMDEDAGYVLKLLSSNLREPLQLQKIHSHRDATPEDAAVKNDFTKQLPELGNITGSQRQTFVAAYKEDMDIFGYTYKDDNLEIGCGHSNPNAPQCC